MRILSLALLLCLPAFSQTPTPKPTPPKQPCDIRNPNCCSDPKYVCPFDTAAR